MIFANGFLNPPGFQSTLVLRTLTGMTWEQFVARNPDVASFLSYLSRQSGIFLFGASLLIIVASVTGFRKGERWAWYTLLAVLLFHLGAIANDLTVNDRSFVLATILAFVGMVLPYRKFFPNKPRAL